VRSPRSSHILTFLLELATALFRTPQVYFHQGVLSGSALILGLRELLLPRYQLPVGINDPVVSADPGKAGSRKKQSTRLDTNTIDSIEVRIVRTQAAPTVAFQPLSI
jgi:hypothetical protein